MQWKHVDFDKGAVSIRRSKTRRLRIIALDPATELLSACIDLRQVARRLGHGGGGATTLEYYVAWVNQSDRRAADVLGSRVQPPRRS